MMTTAQLFLALIGLLATPGPTNALLALAAAQGGGRRALRLVPVVLAAYAAVVLPLWLWGDQALSALPILRPLVTGLAAIWVAWLAVRLWQLPGAGAAPATTVTARHIAVTTLLNPKALILGLVLLPGSGATGLALFALVVPVVSVLWLLLGAGALRRLGPGLNRASAVWLAVLSLTLAARAMAG
ncbi:hypothetical protein LHP98_03540 [Rhodobacter sp. Har01]|uniref:hypothetical protein n=1 Tax=Rhodobacter sp. Har01 TaxID=2883999 RepID=UPI001D079CC2|nr:hypothetical protein [Rhodobacter sp. Har01]MCB6177198.1 hypothetical protein [Rhodobacter sp. Har01]